MTTEKLEAPASRSGWPERVAYLKNSPGEYDRIKTCSSPASAKTIASRIRKYLGEDSGGPDQFEVTVRGEAIFARYIGGSS